MVLLVLKYEIYQKTLRTKLISYMDCVDFVETLTFNLHHLFC